MEGFRIRWWVVTASQTDLDGLEDVSDTEKARGGRLQRCRRCRVSMIPVFLRVSKILEGPLTEAMALCVGGGHGARFKRFGSLYLQGVW